MPIKEADKSYDHKKIEKKIQNFWIEGDTFSKVNKLRANGPQYSFLDGPPYCSGKIHLGTAWNKVIKDSYLRYKSMNGFSHHPIIRLSGKELCCGQTNVTVFRAVMHGLTGCRLKARKPLPSPISGSTWEYSTIASISQQTITIKRQPICYGTFPFH